MLLRASVLCTYCTYVEPAGMHAVSVCRQASYHGMQYPCTTSTVSVCCIASRSRLCWAGTAWRLVPAVVWVCKQSARCCCCQLATPTLDKISVYTNQIRSSKTQDIIQTWSMDQRNRNCRLQTMQQSICRSSSMPPFRCALITIKFYQRKTWRWLETFPPFLTGKNKDDERIMLH